MLLDAKRLFDAIRIIKGSSLTDEDVARINAVIEPQPIAQARRIGPKGLSIIKQFEGLKLVAYQDTGKVWTIGYGHTGPDVKPGMVVTEARADALLLADIADAESDVGRLFPVTTQNQYDALVSFTFNLGRDQVSSSTLRRKHNAGDYVGAKGEFARWVHDNGVKLNGLVKRRAAEAYLYGLDG